MLKKVIATTLALWMILSWCEICTKNLDKNPTYSEYNFWISLIELYDNEGGTK